MSGAFFQEFNEILAKNENERERERERGADVLFLQVVKSLSDRRIDDDDELSLILPSPSSSPLTQQLFILAGIWARE